MLTTQRKASHLHEIWWHNTSTSVVRSILSQPTLSPEKGSLPTRMQSLRPLTRTARPSPMASFFTSCTYHSTCSRKPSAQIMSGAEELFRTHGLPILKGLAVAGVGGVLISRFMKTAEAETSEHKMERKQAAKKIFGRPGPVFTSLALQSSEDVTSDVKRLRFALPAEESISGLPLTSALLTVAVPKGCTLPVLRPYTPVSTPDQPGTLDFVIKRYPHGKQSTHLHLLEPGDKVMFAVVIPGLKWTVNAHDSITLIAGGAGITPCYQLLQGILRNPEDQTKVRLIFGVNNMEDTKILKQELEELEGTVGKDRFRVVYTVAKGAQADGDRFRSGFVTENLVRELAAPPAASTKVLVCGPPGMEDALLGKKASWFGRGEGMLARLGYRKEQIHQF